MKNVIVEEIKDNNVNVAVNSAEHRISEIKREIRECFPKEVCEAPVFELWEENED